jgi:pimeloyl-ACP methyl ester carboxylesterase/DNA-binding MarR family transcriptional regulator
MSSPPHPGLALDGATHHHVALNGTELHYVSAGTIGSPVLLVHGWPETWWAFRAVIPLLAARHRVFAVDLRGFGDSSAAEGAYDEETSAEDLHHLVAHLGVGPVHLLGQDISGGVVFRLAATHPDDVLSLTAVETTLAGYGLEALADVNHGGSWHVGFLGAPGIPELLLPGRERALIADWAYPMMTAVQGAVTDADLDEVLRTYGRPDGWRGTAGLYGSLFADDGGTRALAEAHPLTMPVLTVDAASAPFTESTFRQVAGGEVTAVRLEGVGAPVSPPALTYPPAMSRPGAELALLLLAGFRSIVTDGQAELARRGHGDVRPVHDFAIQAIAAGADNVSDLGKRLGVTRQAAAKTIAGLEERGYVVREADPDDLRRKRLRVTDRGFELLREGGAIFDDLRDAWAERIGRERLLELEASLAELVGPAPPRLDAPGWMHGDDAAQG